MADRQAGTSAAEGSTQRAGQTPGGEQRPDQQRELQVSREAGASSGTAPQRAGVRPPDAGSALAPRGEGQPSLLPAFMANPGLMASAFMTNPFAFAQAMNEEMDRLFSTFGAGGLAPRAGQVGAGSQASQAGRGLARWTPQIEVAQRGNELMVRADLPGLTPDDVQIEIEDGVLTISGERQQATEDRQEGVYRSERSYGAFSRSIVLPDGVDEDQVKARFEHGVLEVTVPLPEQQRQRGRRVPVQSGAAQSSAQGQTRQQTGSAAGDRAAAGTGQPTAT